VALVVLFGFFPTRRLPGAKDAPGVPIVIEIVMLAVGAILPLVIPTYALLIAAINFDLSGIPPGSAGTFSTTPS
jgi:anaerobic C4-dicarboxylate transporter